MSRPLTFSLICPHCSGTFCIENPREYFHSAMNVCPLCGAEIPGGEGGLEDQMLAWARKTKSSYPASILYQAYHGMPFRQAFAETRGWLGMQGVSLRPKNTGLYVALIIFASLGFLGGLSVLVYSLFFA